VDILTLELFDVTASQALRELQRALDAHGNLALRIIGADELVLHNLRRFLDRKGRVYRTAKEGSKAWRLDVDGATAPAAKIEAAEAATVLKPVFLEPKPIPRPVLVLRSAFLPGDRVLGRRLLLGVLAAVPEGTPWVCLAHDAVELLEDPPAMEVLEGLEARGIQVRISEGSRAYHLLAPPFASMADQDWQLLAARGELTVL
jgi:hypothetical protein